MAKRDQAQLKWKKKKWFELTAPEIFKNASLGQALAEEDDALIGRIVQANMMNIVRNPRMQAITMKFRVTQVKEKQGTTEAVSYVMAPSAIKRLVKSRRDRIDDSFVIETKDGAQVRIKPLIITTFNNMAAQRTAIRAAAREQFAKVCNLKTLEEFIQSVVDASLQKEMKKSLSNIVPIRSIDMRAFEIQKAPTNVVAKEPEKVVEEIKTKEE